jgi:exodeoxyribonuclease X
MITVFDTETTGLEDNAEVVEMAAVWLNESTGRIEFQHDFLVNPSIPVTPAARAAHHITDEELRSALPRQHLPVDLLFPNDSAVAAHNLKFDVRMVGSTWPHVLLPERGICTYRCAKHLWPHAPGYSNGVLRYWLELKVPGADGLPAHRALADALVTTAILREQLELRSVDELVRLTAQPALLEKITFGKHRGTRWADVDKGFLRWVLSKDFDEDVMHTARVHLGLT